MRLSRNLEYINHDRLFKELITTFFEEFIILFFPDIHEELDFQKVRFLQQEIFTDVTEGDTHQVDLLVETKWKGNNSIVIVHMESQATYQKDFNKRMFLYFSRIFKSISAPLSPFLSSATTLPKMNQHPSPCLFHLEQSWIFISLL